ncbi:hypothetical protein A2U01_0118101, partial [Trifolium medium]|nr:hypothetical protein [Trifolium medium]
AAASHQPPAPPRNGKSRVPEVLHGEPTDRRQLGGGESGWGEVGKGVCVVSG